MKNELLLLFKTNTLYFICVGLFLLFGTFYYFFSEQGDLIFYFSNHRSAFWDAFFVYGTRVGEEWPYILATLSLLFVRFGYALLVPITGLIVSLFSFLLKSFFVQARPSIYFRELGRLGEITLIPDYPLLSGHTSFPSGHTLSAFALMTLLALLLPRKKVVAVVLFLAALVAGLSRVYLVAHFFQDVLFGAVFGILTAIFIYLAWLNMAARKPNHFLNRSLSGARSG